jgi:nucleoside triphosphate pyrophosphatase
MISLPPLILASQSPRRTALLDAAGLAHIVHPSQCDEIPDGKSASEHVFYWSNQKAAQIADFFPNDMVLGVDTTVAIAGQILGKPADAEEAVAHLGRISGKWHTVYSGVSLIMPAGLVHARELESLFNTRAIRPMRWDISSVSIRWVESSNVQIMQLHPDQVRDYVATGEPLDKAGAYGIQGLGGRLVEKVVGSITNVIGLPLETFCEVFALQGWLKPDFYRERDIAAIRKV